MRSSWDEVPKCQALLKLYVTELDPRSSIVDTVPFWVTWYWCQSSVTSVLTECPRSPVLPATEVVGSTPHGLAAAERAGRTVRATSLPRTALRGQVAEVTRRSRGSHV